MSFHSPHTICVHEGTLFDEATRGVNTPLYSSTSFAYLDTEERIYPRYFNLPNQKAVITKLAKLEGAEDGLLFSSGMAAISTVILGLLKEGDHVIFQHNLYGGTTHFVSKWLNRYGIAWSCPEGNDPVQFEQAIQSNTRMIYIETPSNPLLGITDIAGIAEIGKKHNLHTVIDNTFASPINQNPIQLGINIVIHSATKYLGGHSDICAGAVVSDRNRIQQIHGMAINLGASLNASVCSLLERSMKTLALRVEKQNQNAVEIALFLKGHPAVARVYYPGLEDHPGHEIARRQMNGFGGMLSFELKKEDPVQFQKKLRLIKPSMSLGGVDSIICSPALTSHRHLTAREKEKEGITDYVLRLSIGIEDPADLISDLQQAFTT